MPFSFRNNSVRFFICGMTKGIQRPLGVRISLNPRTGNEDVVNREGVGKIRESPQGIGCDSPSRKIDGAQVIGSPRVGGLQHRWTGREAGLIPAAETTDQPLGARG